MRNKEDYPENWTDEIRPRILKRDGYKCTKCGVRHRVYVLIDSDRNYNIIDARECEEYKKYGANCYRIFLQVAHLNSDKSDNGDSNLAAMCPRCHHRYDLAHKKVMRLASKKKVAKEFPFIP